MKKLPPITALYWAMIISANTIGESGGDLLSQTLNLGYGPSTLLLIGLFLASVALTVATRSQHQALYWLVIILSSTAGTTLSDFITRTLGLGYGWGTLLIVVTLALTFAAWKWATPKPSLHQPLSRLTETLYWIAILVSSTLGTAFGDFFADETPLGFGGCTLVLVVALALLAILYAILPKNRLTALILYWSAIVTTHPLGATAGDYMTKPDGLNLGNLKATLILSAIFALIVALKLLLDRLAPPTLEPLAPQ